MPTLRFFQAPSGKITILGQQTDETWDEQTQSFQPVTSWRRIGTIEDYRDSYGEHPSVSFITGTPPMTDDAIAEFARDAIELALIPMPPK
jgi:hypothetical protein